MLRQNGLRSPLFRCAFTNTDGLDSTCFSLCVFQGYIWGNPVAGLVEALAQESNVNPGFDLIIMSDLIFNHSQVRMDVSTPREDSIDHG